jgi:hypothetical protein
MRRALGLMLLASAALAIPSAQAWADWQYTKWGMTADQVVAASGGAAQLSDAKNPWSKYDSSYLVLATGTYRTGDLEFNSIFQFNKKNKTLQCVKLFLKNKDVAPYTLRQSLESKYGKPSETGDLGGLVYDRWKKTDEITLVVSTRIASTLTYCNRHQIKGADGL